MKAQVISPGQSLITIANQASLDWRIILDFNPGLKPPYSLRAGSIIQIPETADLKPEPVLVFGQVIDARNKLLKLDLGSYATEAEVLSQETVYEPGDSQIARANWLANAQSVLNEVKKRKSQRVGLSSSINWTNIGQ